MTARLHNLTREPCLCGSSRLADTRRHSEDVRHPVRVCRCNVSSRTPDRKGETTSDMSKPRHSLRLSGARDLTRRSDMSLDDSAPKGTPSPDATPAALDAAKAAGVAA